MKWISLLALLNLFNYTDRFLLSASLSQVKADFLLTDFQSGLLFSAFVIPYVFFSLVIAAYADRGAKTKYLKWGSLLWSLAALGSSFSKSFSQLFVGRSLLGLGEAAFASIAPGVLHHQIAPSKQARGMSLFVAALPLGMALGFVGGGALTDLWGWRGAFVALSAPALVLSALFFLVHLPEDVPSEDQKMGFRQNVKSLLGNRTFLLSTLGFSAYLFVAGGVTHWMPSFIQNSFSVSLAEANLYFGGAAISFGILGTFVGGYLSDVIEKRYGNGDLKVCSVSLLLASIPYFLTYSATSKTELIVCISLSQFLFFLSNSPINVITLKSVGRHQASFAMALQIFICHLLGDALSAPLIGRISDITGDLGFALRLCTPVIVLGGVLWALPLFKKNEPL